MAPSTNTPPRSPAFAHSPPPLLLLLLLLSTTIPSGRAAASVAPASSSAEEIPSLSEYGFDHSWSASEGWFLFPPYFDGDPGTVFAGVESAPRCAEMCSEVGPSVGGEYEGETGDCYCYSRIDCLEPCAGLMRTEGEKKAVTVEFAIRPLSDFPFCHKSVCEYFYESNREYCDDPGVGYDEAECAAKLSAYVGVAREAQTPPDILAENVAKDVTDVCVEKDEDGAEVERWECTHGGTCSENFRYVSPPERGYVFVERPNADRILCFRVAGTDRLVRVEVLDKRGA